jgi:predicted transposase/invertase (TIGR01784 family)
MAEDSIHHPNDKLLKATFSVPENARCFFQNHLPQNLAKIIDWDSLTIEPSTFIDPQFASSESDLLFKIRLQGTEAFIYLLFEHQSSEDPRMALRLLSYILRIWERFAKSHASPAKLPAVLPVVIAQGKKPWKTGMRLQELIDLPDRYADILLPWQPALTYQLLELVRIRYEDIAGTPEGILTLRALKAEPVDELLGDELWDESLLSISERALEQLLRYILNADLRVPALRERIRKIHVQPLQNTTMTLAERLKEEGQEEGLRALRASVLRALEIRFGGYPEGIREAVEAKHQISDLERLIEAAIRSNSIEEFSRGL